MRDIIQNFLNTDRESIPLQFYPIDTYTNILKDFGYEMEDLEARNLNVLVKLTNIPQGTISQQLSRGLQNVPKGEFIFKYKEEEIEL